ncbi:MAG: hypothetical protein AAF213_01450 [Pseudomonadota bacterium]
MDMQRLWAGAALLLAAALGIAPAIAFADEKAADETLADGYALGRVLDQIEVSAQLAFEPRFFPSGPRYADQFEGIQLSGFLKPELFWENEARDKQVSFVPFFRLDTQDDERTHGDIREAYFRGIVDDWEYLIGLNQVFWGVTESRHLVNIINQIDGLEDVNEEDFLGQPMINVARQTDIGRFDFFLMTGFRERTFPGPDGRLRGPLPVNTDRVQYESDLEEWRPDIALRYSHFIGDIDLGLHLFHGTGREPDLVLSADGQTVLPRYTVITQAGIDLQYTRDEWLWKFEGLVREGQGSTFLAAVAGFEYTWFQALDSDADLGFLAEILYDGRDEDTLIPGNRSGAVQASVFDKDLFFGSRLTLNDIQDTAILGGMVVDLEDGPAALRLEAERRLGDTWKIELIGQAYLEDDPANPASVLDRDHFVTLRLSKFF